MKYTTEESPLAYIQREEMVHCFLVKPDQVFFDKKGDLQNQSSTYTAVGLLVLGACRGKD
jgi:hypothetical protein